MLSCFQVLSSDKPTDSYLLDDAGAINKTTKKEVNDRLKRLDFETGFRVQARLLLLLGAVHEQAVAVVGASMCWHSEGLVRPHAIACPSVCQDELLETSHCVCQAHHTLQQGAGNTVHTQMTKLHCLLADSPA